jgi:hypothetical protein
MDENAIVLIGETSVTIWDFPRLSGNAQEESLKPEPSDPAIPRASLHIPAADASPHQNCRGTGLCDWYTGGPHPVMFDQLERTWSSLDFELFRFEVSLQSQLQIEDQLLFTPNLPIRLPRTTPRPPYMLRYRKLGKNLVVGWSDGENVFCHAGPMVSDSLPVVTTLLNLREHDMRRVSFCPISGKMCYFDPATKEVKVLHYFTSPPAGSMASN